MLNITRMVVGPVMTNCYIVSNQDTGECVAVDPGDNAEAIISRVGETGCVLKAILLTHGHFDHIMAIPGLRKHYADIPVYAYKEEKILLEDAVLNEGGMINKSVTVTDVTYLEDRQKLDLLGVSWELISTPGHTVGSCCWYIEEAAVLFSGDTLFDGDCGRTDFATGDPEAIVHSIRDVLMKLPDDTQVLPGHESFTTIGRERRYNIVMRMNGIGF